MKTKFRKHRKDKPQPAHPGGPSAGVQRRHLILLLAMLLIAGGTWAVFEFVIWNVTPPELVGTWVVVRGPTDQQGAIFEFHRNGTLVGHLDPDGAHRVVNARIRVEDNKIYATTRHPTSGQELTRVQTVQRVTQNELVLMDEQGKVLVMRRDD